MIREFSIHAKPTNKKAMTAFTACFFASFAALIASGAFQFYRWVPQLIGMVLLVAAVALYTKFLSSKYYYEIVFDTEGTPLLVVNQLIGKRMTALCRVGLYEVVRVESESAEERKNHKTPAGIRKYTYVPTLFPERTCRIYTSGKHERAEIVIEVTDEISALLSDYAREARELMEAREGEEEY